MYRTKRLLRKTVVPAAASIALLLFAAVALAGSGFKNGGFETGDFTKWQIADTNGNGSWFVSDKKVTPITGSSWFGPPEKEFMALTDFGFVDSLVLYRPIKIGSKHTRVSFIVEYKNQAEVWCTPDDLTPTGCNEQMRVDIIADGADPYSMDPGDVLRNLFKTSSSDPFSQGPTKINADLGGLSGTVVLRVAVVATEFIFNGGIDAVTVNNG
jgi:hypothetical protein